MENEPKGYSLEVNNPRSVVSSKFQNAPRLEDLNGKTICEWISWRQQFSAASEAGDPNREMEGHWRELDTFPVIRELLKKRFPDIKIVPGQELPCYEDYLPNAPTGSSQQERLNIITTAMKEKGCDAVILGNGS